MKIKLLSPTAKVPTKAHITDACYDLYSDQNITLGTYPNNIFAVRTGISIEIPEGCHVEIVPRSGLAIKHGVTVLNSPGIIDFGFSGEIQVILINLGLSPISFYKGDRIAQLKLVKDSNFEFEIVKELASSERGENGFGSTGK